MGTLVLTSLLEDLVKMPEHKRTVFERQTDFTCARQRDLRKKWQPQSQRETTITAVALGFKKIGENMKGMVFYAATLSFRVFVAFFLTDVRWPKNFSKGLRDHLPYALGSIGVGTRLT